MNLIKSVIAVSVMIFAAQASAMVIVHTPDFPVDKNKDKTVQAK